MKSSAPYSAVLYHHSTQKWWAFTAALHIVSSDDCKDIPKALTAVEDYVNCHNAYAVGWVSYEAAPAFDSRLVVHDSDFPKLWFSLYPPPIILDALPPIQQRPALAEFCASVTEQQYCKQIASIQQRILQGDCYQINYTFLLAQQHQRQHDIWQIFLELAVQHPANFSAYIDTGAMQICCNSPELFFSLNGRHIYSQPMKGTSKRGRCHAEDMDLADKLQHSIKNRAENVMIVDMVRNDLSKISQDRVVVDALFTLEKYPSLWQLTSTVSTLTDAGVVDIFTALFPAASITGAPKNKAMEIIHEHEQQPRGVYTGSIGYIAPNRQMQFNVAIRTLIARQQQLRYHIGSGIIIDSQANAEFTECIAKAGNIHSLGTL